MNDIMEWSWVPSGLLEDVKEAFNTAIATHQVRDASFWGGDRSEYAKSMKTDVKLVKLSVSSNSGDWEPGKETGSELDLLILVKWRNMSDLYATIHAMNDYTGWGCHGDMARIRIGKYEDVVRFGLSDEDRRRLNVELS